MNPLAPHNSSSRPALVLMCCVLATACTSEPESTRLHVERPHPVFVSGGDGGAELGPETTAEVSDVEVALDTEVVAQDGTELVEVPESIIDSTTLEGVSEVVDSAPDEADTAQPQSFPWVRTGDTRTTQRALWDRYACAPDTDESGPEDVYTIEVTQLGILRATLDDVAGDAVDLDVHLLSAADPAACVQRANAALAWVVRPGTWTIAVDSWVGSNGIARVGPYRLEVTFLPLDSGRCAVDDIEQRMFWSACAKGAEALDCSDDGTTRRLRVPSFGPVVGEAHLVTVDESFPGDGWPTALRDQIERHYAISAAATGYVMARDEPWAPEGEGGSHWGGGATGQKLPVLDEAWYVNMYWRDRPTRGRRMLVVEPWSGRAVVAAGGWETGPGSNTAIGGATEEVHHALGSGHRDELVMAFLSDDTLPLGPITCW